MNWIRKFWNDNWLTLASAQKKTVIGLSLAVLVLVVVLVSFTQQNQSVSTGSWLSSGGQSLQSKSGSTASTSSGNQSTSSLQTTTVVQVVGEIKHPGVYELKYGDRVFDAVFAAGGFTKKADQSSVNLARPVNDGEQINILSISANANTQQSQANQTVNLNFADESALDTLPGIGTTLAQRILDYRQTHGGFQSLNDLGKVSGIGPSLLAKLKPLVSL